MSFKRLLIAIMQYIKDIENIQVHQPSNFKIHYFLKFLKLRVTSTVSQPFKDQTEYISCQFVHVAEFLFSIK